MEGPRIVLPTGTLTHRFFGVRKVDPPKLALATGIGRFRDPFFGRKKVTFLEKSAKIGLGVLPGGKGATIRLFCTCHLYTFPSPRDLATHRMPSSA